MQEDVLKNIDDKLGVIIKLLANDIVKDKSKTDAIYLLGDIGLDVSLIAQIVDTTSNTVSTRLSEHRKKAPIKNVKTLKTEGK